MAEQELPVALAMRADCDADTAMSTPLSSHIQDLAMFI
jgi:hypothetical protein